MSKFKKLWANFICWLRGHPKEITFWAKDFAFDETCEYIRCDCGKRRNFVRMWGKYYE
jgi:hypothetical protein